MLDDTLKLDALTREDLQQVRDLTIEYRLDFEVQHREFMKVLGPEELADAFMAGAAAEDGIRDRYKRGEITRDQATGELILLMHGLRAILESTIKDCERRIAAMG